MAENTSDKYKWVISSMPYGNGFLFVDEIIAIDENSIEANFSFRSDLSFYKDHFKHRPITPGVVLTECMAQIGLVAFGIFNYFEEKNKTNEPKIVLTSTNVEFYKPVYPNDKVTVVAEKQYFRFGKLKSMCKMYNREDKLICKGEISGMIDMNKDE